VVDLPFRELRLRGRVSYKKRIAAHDFHEFCQTVPSSKVNGFFSGRTAPNSATWTPEISGRPTVAQTRELGVSFEDEVNEPNGTLRAAPNNSLPAVAALPKRGKQE